MPQKQGQGVILNSEKINEIKRLLSLGFTHRKVASIVKIARSSIWKYRQGLKGISSELKGLEGSEVECVKDKSSHSAQTPSCSIRFQPDFHKIHLELYSHKGMTLELLWQEYCEQGEGRKLYSYSHFTALYSLWRKEARLVFRQVHKAGEKAFVDYAGVTVPYYDASEKQMKKAQIFVGVLGLSNYTYVKAVPSQKKPDFIRCLREMLEFFGGVPKAIVVDNLKSCVLKADRYDPDLNPTMELFSAHYNTTLWPTAPRSPTHKAKVETGVQIVERFFLARFRHRQFQGLSEIQEEISKLLPELNKKIMKSCGQSRFNLFEAYEKPALGALPIEGFHYTFVEKKRVGHDYHVEHEKVYYSVPSHLSNQLVSLRSGERSLSIFHQNRCVAVHTLSHNPLEPQTHPEHRPRQHQSLMPWSKEDLLKLASSIGKRALEMTESILKREEALPDLASRKILSRLRLAEEYGKASLEEGITKAMERHPNALPKVRQLRGWLKRCSRKGFSGPWDDGSENLRGPDYYAHYLKTFEDSPESKKHHLQEESGLHGRS